MIGKVTRGKNVGGLLRYLFGPGRANEHTNPHLVGSWLGDNRPTLDGLEPTFEATRPEVAGLSSQLALPMQLRPDAIDKPVWQCSMRVADGDRSLTDAEWAGVARDVVERTGFAPAGDTGGCRWVAVRHADDHIHIAVVLARQDGARVEVFRDWPKVHAAARAAEQRFGLQVVASPDRTATVAPTRAEEEKAARTATPASPRAPRTSRPMPARAWLTRQVRAAAAGSVSPEEFEAALVKVGVAVHWRESQRVPGQLTGYAVGRPGDVDADGAQVWFGGSKLSPDLSLPKLRARWDDVADSPAVVRVPRQRPPTTPRQRGEVLDRAERALRRAIDDPATPGRAVAAGEVAATIAGLVEGPDGGPLTEAAEDLSRLARRPGGHRPRTRGQVQALRDVAASLSLLGYLSDGELRSAVLLVSHLVRIGAAIHGGRPAAARLAHAAVEISPKRSQRRGEAGPARAVSEALPDDVARVVLSDPAWPVLAVELASTDNPTERLRTAYLSRDLQSAESPAAVLHYRLVSSATASPVSPWRAKEGAASRPELRNARRSRPR